MKITSNVISGDIVHVPDEINVVGGRSSMSHLLRANVALVKALPIVEGGVAKLPTDLALMVLVGFVGISKLTPTTTGATTTTATLNTTMLLLHRTSVATMPTSSYIGHHVKLVLLLPLCLMGSKTRLSVKEPRV
jgi:nitrate reductase gamma subunit